MLFGSSLNRVGELTANSYLWQATYMLYFQCTLVFLYHY